MSEPAPRPLEPRPLRLRLPTGRVVTVVGLSPSHTVDQLAAVLGWSPGGLRIDGRPAPGSRPLGRTGLHEGSLVERLTSTPPQAPAHARVVLEVQAGPDAGHRVPLPPGRHVVGRAPAAAVRLADDLLEPHHLMLDVGVDGEVRLVALAGRALRLVGGGDLPQVVGTDGTVLRIGEPVEVGASRLVLQPPASPPAAVRGWDDPSDPWRRVVHRGPRKELATPAAVPPPRVAEPAVVAPTPLLGPALTSCGVAALVALVTGQAMVLLLGAALAAAGIVGWGLAHWQRWRARRRHSSAVAAALETFERAVIEHQAQRAATWRQRLPPLPEVLARIEAGSVWTCRPTDGWWVAVGPGWVDHDAELVSPPTSPAERAVVERHRRLHDVPVAVELAPGQVVGLVGPHRMELARSILVQLAGSLGPADWTLHVRSRHPELWSWTDWLPHRAATDELPRGERAVVAVVDDPTLVSARTAPIRRALAQGAPVAVLLLVEHRQALPAWCTCVVELGVDGLARCHGWPTGAVARAAGLSEARALDAAAALAGCSDPEDSDGPGALPERVSTSALHGDITVPAVVARWRAGGSDPAPVVPLGLAADGIVEIDLVRDGPHGLVAGTTGAGKSELLRTLVVGLALSSPPEHLSLILIDYKGGAAFDACATLPHVVGVVTDLDERLAERVLRSLDAELRRRERLLRDHGAAELAGYRQRVGVPALPRLVVVVDEFATLAADVPGFVPALVSVAQRGRSLGVHLILATQRPGGAVSDDIRSNTNLRIALRVQDAADSVEVIGDPAAALLPRSVPGRAVVRLGAGDLIAFQSGCTSIPSPSVAAGPRLVEPGSPTDRGDALTELVHTVTAAADAWKAPRPTPPWLPPLPPLLAPVELAATPGTVGLVDDPDRQRQLPLTWSRRGHLLIAGAAGSGTTSALIALARSLALAEPIHALHLYVVDGRCDPRLEELAALAHVGAVVRASEAERLTRLVSRLEERIDSGVREPAIVVLVDGVATVRSALDDGRSGGWLERFDRIVADGPAAGVVLAVTTEHPAHLPALLVGACSERWVLRLADPADATLVGVPSSAAPPANAPPGRAVVWPALLEAQLASPEGWPSSQRAGATGPPPISVLPAEVPAAVGCGRSSRHQAGCRLFVGLGSSDLAPVAIDVPRGEHLLVIGPPRSGRTSTLARLAESWRCATGADSVVWWSGRDRASAAAHLLQLGDCQHELLLVVDDADLVDDPDGRLARLITGGHAGLTVVASARPGALRSAYGHWTHAVRRSRRGLLLDGVDELDADLLGAVLPRDRRVPPRPGRGWLVVDGVAVDVVQVARHSGMDHPSPGGSTLKAGAQASRTPSTMCTVRSQ